MTRDKEKTKNALQRLEKIVEELGKDDVDVESGLEKFKEGVALIKYLRGQLKKAENEFVKLKEELELSTEPETEDAGGEPGEDGEE